MKRGGPLKRRTPLRARRRRDGVEFPPAVRDEVRQRAGWRCERCRLASIDHFHHRLRRSAGGKGTAANCAALCVYCHEYVHDHPEVGYAEGWLLHGWDGAA